MLVFALFATLLLSFSEASEVALLIGGFGSSDASQVITPDGHCLGSQSSPVIPKAPDGRVGWSAQYVDGEIILCGGAKESFYRDCWHMTIGGNSWAPASESMVYQKRYAESLVFNGEMYVLGGYNLNQGWLDVIEKRDSATGKWTEVWTLPRKIFDSCAVVHDNKIIVLGKAFIKTLEVLLVLLYHSFAPASVFACSPCGPNSAGRLKKNQNKNKMFFFVRRKYAW